MSHHLLWRESQAGSLEGLRHQSGPAHALFVAGAENRFSLPCRVSSKRMAHLLPGRLEIAMKCSKEFEGFIR